MKRFLSSLISKKALISLLSVFLVVALTTSTVLVSYPSLSGSQTEESADVEDSTENETEEETEETEDSGDDEEETSAGSGDSESQTADETVETGSSIDVDEEEEIKATTSGAWNSNYSSFTIGDAGTYYISAGKYLAYLAYKINNGETYSGYTFKLSANIDLSAHYWDPIGNIRTGSWWTTVYRYFAGTFDGNGYTISGLYVSCDSDEDDQRGLFGYTNGATIKNVVISSGTVKGNDDVGSIVGYAVSTTIENCTNSASVSPVGYSYTFSRDGAEFTGGLVGRAESCTIKNSVNNGSVQIEEMSSLSFGGIVGYATSCTIESCSNSGSVYLKGYFENFTHQGVGGIVGYVSDCTITKCVNTASVFSLAPYVGGIVGYATGSSTSITYCINTRLVDGYDEKSFGVGGIVGVAQGGGTDESNWIKVENCANLGYVYGYGHNKKKTDGYYASTGGIVGSGYRISISKCFNTGAIYGEDDRVGGIVGNLGAYFKVTHCYNTGSVTGTKSDDLAYAVGGIVGYANASDNGTSYSIVGVCYNTATISGYSDIGGVIGGYENYIIAVNCFNLGSISSSDSTYKGGVYGKKGSNTFNYGNIGSATASNMTTLSYYTNTSNWKSSTLYYWDMTDSYNTSYIWLISSTVNDGLPVLMWSVNIIAYYKNRDNDSTPAYYYVVLNDSHSVQAYTSVWPNYSSGSAFDSWNTKSDGTGTTYKVSDTYSFGDGVYGTTFNLYAIWKQYTYNINFYTYTGSGTKKTNGNYISGENKLSASEQKKTYDTSTTVDMPEVTAPSGYTFIGWNTSASGQTEDGWHYEGESVTLNYGSTTAESKDFNFYAIYVDSSKYWQAHVTSPSQASDGYYEIDSAEKLAYIANLINNGTNSDNLSIKIRLTCDIDLSDYLWVPIGVTYNRAFNGTFDGQGYTISGLHMTCSSPYDPYYWGGRNKNVSNDNNLYLGLFGKIGTSAKISNVIIKTSTDAGSIRVGYAYSTNNDYTSYDYNQYNTTYVGGAVAFSYGTLSQVAVVGGSSTQIIKVQYNSNSSNCYSYVGGLVGYGGYYSSSYYCKMDECFASVGIYASGAYRYIGGMVGYSYGAENTKTAIDNCFANSSITTNNATSVYVGGCAGYVKRTRVSRSFAIPTFSGSPTYKGSFVGYGDNCTMNSCFANSSVNFSGYYTSSTLTNVDYSTTDSKVSTYKSGTASLYTSDSSYKWSITTGTSASDLTGSVWVTNQSAYNSGLPMLTWCLTAVTLADDPSGLADSISAASISMNYGSLSSFTLSSSSDTFLVFSGSSFNATCTKDSNLIFAGWFVDSETTKKSEELTYNFNVGSSIVRNSACKLTAKFSGVTVNTVYSFLYNEKGKVTDSPTSGTGTVSLKSGSNESDQYDFTRATSKSANFDMLFDAETTITVTPNVGYALVRVEGVDYDNTTFTVFSNEGSDFNGIATYGQVTGSSSSESYNLYVSPYCVNNLRFYFVKVIYELTYTIKNLDSTSSSTTYRVTYSGTAQTSIDQKTSTNSTATNQDLFALVGTHRFGQLWTLTIDNNSYTTMFEDVESGYLSTMQSSNDSYGMLALKDFITNSTNPSINLTLTAKAIEYYFDTTTQLQDEDTSALSGSTDVGTVEMSTAMTITSTRNLLNLFNVNTSQNYFLFRVVNSTSSSNVDVVTANTSLSTSSIFYGYISTFCKSNLASMATDPSATHTSISTMNFIYMRGHYIVGAQNNAGSAYTGNLTLNGTAYDGDELLATLGIVQTLGVSNSEAYVNFYCGGKLMGYKATSLDFTNNQVVATSWNSSTKSYYQDEAGSKNGVANYQTKTIALEKWTITIHSYDGDPEVRTATAGVYKIASAEDLQWIADLAASGETFEGKLLVQVCDIDMSGVRNFSPIGYDATNCFAGTYDGGGFRIIGLKISSAGTDADGIDSEETNLGLFGYTVGATIKNLTLDGGSISGYANVGAFVGYAENTTFYNLNNKSCDVSGETVNINIYTDLSGTSYDTYIRTYGNYFGGIAGYAKNCTFSIVSNQVNVNQGLSSTNENGVSTSHVIGGLVGGANVYAISQCYSNYLALYGKDETSNSSDSSVSECYWKVGSTKYYTYGTRSGTTTAPTSANYSKYSTYWGMKNGSLVLLAFYW